MNTSNKQTFEEKICKLQSTDSTSNNSSYSDINHSQGYNASLKLDLLFDQDYKTDVAFGSVLQHQKETRGNTPKERLNKRQKRQRDKKKEQEKQSEDKITQMKYQRNEIQQQQRNLKSQVYDLQSKIQDKSEEILYHTQKKTDAIQGLKLRSGKWQQIYMMRQTQIPEYMLKNIKIVEFSVLYQNFISRISQLAQQYFNMQSNSQKLDLLQVELQDQFHFIQKIMVYNPTIIKEVMQKNLDTLQDEKRDHCLNECNYVKLVDNLQLSNFQKNQIYQTMDEHIDRLLSEGATSQNLINGFNYNSTNVQNLLRSNSFLIVDSKLLVYYQTLIEDLKIVEEIVQKEIKAMQSMYLQLFTETQIVEIFQNCFPQIPDFYFVLVIIYVQQRRRVHKLANLEIQSSANYYDNESFKQLYNQILIC